MNLYNKYRPISFDEVVGNEDVIDYLSEIVLKGKEVPNAFLLHGPTGCGKTTVARIISNLLGCIDEDLTEIDNATFRGIDTVRQMNRNSRFNTTGGGPRVFLIDEIHKMTSDAQNAMLKLLEDPPRSTYFILCTTEPNKLLPTIRGRCISLQMKVLNDTEMTKVLKRIIKKEKVKVKRKVLEQIIRDSFGHARNAIQVLDKIIKLSPGKQLKAAKQAAEEQSLSIELCRALANGVAWSKVRELLKGLKDQEAESIRRHVLGYAQSMLLGSENDQAALIIEEFWEPLYNIGFLGLVFACYSVVKR